MQKILKQFQSLKGNRLIRSMFLSTMCKPMSMVISLLYTPVLLNYLGVESYGVWSTILSIINWVNYFDIGIGNGLRNMLTKYIDKKEDEEARRAVSTGYIALSVISGVILIIGSLAIFFMNDHEVFNTTLSIKPAIFTTFTCICINFILALSKVQLYASHQAEKVGFMTLATQGINLLGIIGLSLFSKGSLFGVAVIIGFSGIIVNIWFTDGIWKKYKYLIPSLNRFDKSKLSGICNVGIKFFIVQIAALILYSTDNMIITQLFGPSRVTPYYTVYSAFGIVNGLFGAMMAPLWSKYTVALEHRDYLWINETILKLDKLLPIIIAILTIASLIFKPFSVVWLHKNLSYDVGLIPCMGVYYVLIIWGSIYATAMNGMGRINLQIFMGAASAILNIPLSIFFGRTLGMGTTGVAFATVLCMFATDLVITIDMHRYLNRCIKLKMSNG